MILVQSVSDSGVRFQYPGVRFLVPDSPVLVSDPGVRFRRRPKFGLSKKWGMLPNTNNTWKLNLKKWRPKWTSQVWPTSIGDLLGLQDLVQNQSELEVPRNLNLVSSRRSNGAARSEPVCRFNQIKCYHNHRHFQTKVGHGGSLKTLHLKLAADQWRTGRLLWSCEGLVSGVGSADWGELNPYGGFLKWGYPQSSPIYRWMFHTPSISGYPHLWKTPI